MKEEKAGPVLMAVGKPGEPATWIIPKPKPKVDWVLVFLFICFVAACIGLLTSL